MLPFRIQTTPQCRFSDLIAQIKSKLLNSLANHPISFQELIKLSGVITDKSYSPLFQTAFVFETFERYTPHLKDLACAEVPFEPDLSKYDLLLGIHQKSGMFYGRFEYNQQLFTPDSIQAWVQVLSWFMEQAVENIELSLEKFSYMATCESKALIAKLSASQEFKTNSTLVENFERSCHLYADRPALVRGGQKTSYDQLNKMSGLIGAYLQARGVGKGDFVAVSMTPSEALIASILGILKAGAAYVPIDPQTPTERQAYILKDSGSKLILRDTNTPICESSTVLDINIEKLLSESEGVFAPTLKKIKLAPSDLCYVIYTSGTTGNPKGVGISHDNVNRVFLQQ